MKQNSEITQFLDSSIHPVKEEIELMRSIILEANKEFGENIKWNGPIYTFAGADRISMRTEAPKQIQLIFKRGAKGMTDRRTFWTVGLERKRTGNCPFPIQD